MNPVVGHASAWRALAEAVAGGQLHHAWLLAGPEGVGKASFAREAAARLLATALDGHDRMTAAPGEDHRVRQLLASGAHPDYRAIVRLPKDPDKPEGEVARSIRIDQVRALQPMFATKPALSGRRVVVIDAADDLERAGANALLKNLEEPPAGTVFLLVAHAPGRLLPTIRSRCRQLRFEPLSDADVERVLRAAEVGEGELTALVAAAEGAPGRALAYAGLGIDAIDRDLASIAATGDPDNAVRSRMARALAGKAAQPRYGAFLERVPTFLAAQARSRQGDGLRSALDAYAAARALATLAAAVTLDPATTVFEMGGIVATLAPGGPMA